MKTRLLRREVAVAGDAELDGLLFGPAEDFDCECESALGEKAEGLRCSSVEDVWTAVGAVRAENAIGGIIANAVLREDAPIGAERCGALGGYIEAVVGGAEVGDRAVDGDCPKGLDQVVADCKG